MKNIILKLSQKNDFSSETLEIDGDLLHMLIYSVPTISVSSIVRVLKQQSVIAIWKNHSNELKKYFWKGKTFWTNGYFVSSIGQVSETTVKKYIEIQG